MNGEIVDEEEMKNEDGTTIAAQTLTYNAMVDHNGMELTCTVNHQGYTDDQMNNNENKKSLLIDIKCSTTTNTTTTSITASTATDTVTPKSFSNSSPTQFPQTGLIFSVLFVVFASL